jgi:nitroimidazol reductase NimA-like FMN-containing flavoprotein (pyridoxamine 5'-phosphate oxidase superfamily)
MNQTAADLETMGEEECLDLLVRHHLGRIALLAGEQPLIFPVNYAYGDRVIAFRTGPGTKLAAAPHARVAFEIDDYDPLTGIGWSVVVQGVAYEITDAMDRQSQLARRLFAHPLAPGQRDHWIGIHPTGMSGRRFRSAV